MKELDAIIEEQAMLLMWKGYNEKHLQNGEPEGSYKEHFKSALQDLLENRSLLLDNEPFELRLFGNFNHGKDTVLFTFSYHYDASLSQVALKQVEARLDGVPLTIAVDKGSDLWASQEMYARVKSLSSTINQAIDKEREADLANIIGYEVTLLNKAGYINTNLEKKFSDIARKAPGTKKELHFIIEGKQKMGDEQETMHYKLYYRFRPDPPMFRLKEVNASLGNITESFLPNRHYPVPAASDIYSYLADERRTQTARQILQHQEQTGNTEKKIPR